MTYAFLSLQIGHPIKPGALVYWRTKGWYGRVARPDRDRCRVLRIKLPGEKGLREVDPMEVDFNVEVG